MTDNNENNITFFIDDNDDNDCSNNENDYLLELDTILNDYQNENERENTEIDLKVSQMVDYSINYTVKDLLLICDYYGIGKNLKYLKANKEQIIESIVIFENDSNHTLIVIKRRKLWFYINELKKDKFMKKYIVLW